MALNHLWKAGFTREELMKIGLELGADVPFFIFGRNAFAEGVGERLQTIDTPPRWYLVLEPGVSVPTPAIFSSPELTRNTKAVKITDFSAAPANFGRNDLQAVAVALFPEVAKAVSWLESYGKARMTGSGACVFCGFETEHQADAALEKVPARWKAWKAKAIERHPLSHLLEL
jgi:4-diphosphocytidyl-2-C-methyl-D-erythritol kinase